MTLAAGPLICTCLIRDRSAWCGWCARSAVAIAASVDGVAVEDIDDAGGCDDLRDVCVCAARNVAQCVDSLGITTIA